MALRLSGSRDAIADPADLEAFEQQSRQQAIEAVRLARQRLDYAEPDMIDACVLELQAAETRLRIWTGYEAYRDPDKVQKAKHLLGRLWQRPQLGPDGGDVA